MKTSRDPKEEISKATHTESEVGSGIFVFLNESQESKDLLTSINEFRKLTGLTWKRFTLLAIAERVTKDNPDLALQIVDFVTRARGAGRPPKGK